MVAGWVRGLGLSVSGNLKLGCGERAPPRGQDGFAVKLRRALAAMNRLGDSADRRQFPLFFVVMQHEGSGAAARLREGVCSMRQQGEHASQVFLRVVGNFRGHGLQYISANFFALCANFFEISFPVLRFIVDEAEKPGEEPVWICKFFDAPHGFRASVLADVLGFRWIAAGTFGAPDEGRPVSG